MMIRWRRPKLDTNLARDRSGTAAVEFALIVPMAIVGRPKYPYRAPIAPALIGPEAPADDGATVRTRLRSGLPYGPAIAAGGLWVAAHLAGA